MEICGEINPRREGVGAFISDLEGRADVVGNLSEFVSVMVDNNINSIYALAESVLTPQGVRRSSHFCRFWVLWAGQVGHRSQDGRECSRQNRTITLI